MLLSWAVYFPNEKNRKPTTMGQGRKQQVGQEAGTHLSTQVGWQGAGQVGGGEVGGRHVGPH